MGDLYDKIFFMLVANFFQVKLCNRKMFQKNLWKEDVFAIAHFYSELRLFCQTFAQNALYCLKKLSI